MKYKIGDKVIITGDYKKWKCIKEYRKGKNLKNKVGKIIKIYKRSNHNENTYHDIKIINCPYKKECKYFKGDHYCHTWYEYEIKSLNYYKLKKLIEHGV